MSYDQRPGRIRVVQDAAEAPKRRRGDQAQGAGDLAISPAAGAAAAQPSLPIVPALLFLLACIGGGVAVALFGAA